MAASDKVQPGWFSLRGAAIYTGFHENAIRTAIAGRKFPVKDVEVAKGSRKKNPRIKREHLDAWIEGKEIDESEFTKTP